MAKSTYPRLFSALVCLLVAAQLHAAEPAKAADEFLLFNELRFAKQPDISPWGFQPLKVIYSSALWKGNKTSDQPDLTHLDQFLPNKLAPEEYYCIDIEHWPLDSRATDAATVNASLGKYIAVLNKFRQYHPNAKLGYYSMLPIRDYWTPVSGKKLGAWQLANSKLSTLANSVDVIYPSLYAFYKDPEQWTKYAIGNIREARKYGKPVIAYLWPQYHNSSRFRSLDLIDKDFWRLQLETVYEHADGVVLWSPTGKMQLDWDENAGWWQATKEFIQAHGLNNGNRVASPSLLKISSG